MLPLTWGVAVGSSVLPYNCGMLSKPRGGMGIKVPDMPAVIPILAGMVAPITR